ncbi:10509_t:CDS:2, partial [Dentiscutata heterogama]
WVQDKKQTWTLAALSSAFTKMLYNIWINSLFTTNASESAHATINTTGQNLSLSSLQRNSVKRNPRYSKEADFKESSHEQEQLLNKLTMQKNLNDKLEREIRLRQQLQLLYNPETNN